MEPLLNLMCHGVYQPGELVPARCIFCLIFFCVFLFGSFVFERNSKMARRITKEEIAAEFTARLRAAGFTSMESSVVCDTLRSGFPPDPLRRAIFCRSSSACSTSHYLLMRRKLFLLLRPNLKPGIGLRDMRPFSCRLARTLFFRVAKYLWV